MSPLCIVNDLGSIRTDVRYTFDSRHRQAGPTGPFSAKLGSDGLSFRIFNALRGRAFFPDRQREAHCSRTSRSAAAPNQNTGAVIAR
jgi:hypothetical protein